MMKLDFLCPGEWGDSYEARIINPNSLEDCGGYVVTSMQDVLNACRIFISAVKKFTYDSGYFDLFKYVEIYIDSRCAGTLYETGRLRLCPLCQIDVESMTVYYPYGDRALLFDVNSYEYLGRK